MEWSLLVFNHWVFRLIRVRQKPRRPPRALDVRWWDANRGEVSSWSKSKDETPRQKGGMNYEKFVFVCLKIEILGFSEDAMRFKKAYEKIFCRKNTTSLTYELVN